MAGMTEGGRLTMSGMTEGKRVGESMFEQEKDGSEESRRPVVRSLSLYPWAFFVENHDTEWAPSHSSMPGGMLLLIASRPPLQNPWVFSEDGRKKPEAFGRMPHP